MFWLALGLYRRPRPSGTSYPECIGQGQSYFAPQLRLIEGIFEGPVARRCDSATVQHRKGIYIETPTGTPKGSDYGIYQDASSVLNYFGGKVGIGTDAPSNTLHVLGSLCVKSTAGN